MTTALRFRVHPLALVAARFVVYAAWLPVLAVAWLSWGRATNGLLRAVARVAGWVAALGVQRVA